MTIDDWRRRLLSQALTAEEAAELHRELTRAQPKEHARDCAKALVYLTISRSKLGHHEEAVLAAAEEAVSLYSNLASDQPETFTADLAMSLNNLVITRLKLDRHTEALLAAEEAVSLYRKLASDHPETYPALAVSLNNLTRSLYLLDRGEEAELIAAEAANLLTEHPRLCENSGAKVAHRKSFSISVNLKTKSAGDGYREKGIEKSILRNLGSYKGH